MLYRASAGLIVVAALSGLCSTGAAAAPDAGGAFEARVVVVNIERVLTTSAPAQEANRRIFEEFDPREKALEQNAVQLRQMAQKLERDAAQLPERDRIRRSRELDELERDASRQRAQFREDLAERQAKARAAVAARVYEVLKALPQEQHVDLVLINTVWNSARVDATDKVLKMLER
jgi:outer membrane protein